MLEICVMEHKFMQPKILYDCLYILSAREQTIGAFIYHRDRFLFVVFYTFFLRSQLY